VRFELQLIVSRYSESRHGLSVSLKDEDKIEGNKPEFTGPVVLFNLDQEIVYGLSHREVVSRIYAEGPQPLITTKELAHRLYEHGMKASLGKIKLNNTPFLTCLDTYYNTAKMYGRLTLVNSKDRLGVVFCFSGYKPILITNAGFKDKETAACRIDIDKIQSEVTQKLINI